MNIPKMILNNKNGPYKYFTTQILPKSAQKLKKRRKQRRKKYRVCLQDWDSGIKYDTATTKEIENMSLIKFT